MIMKKRIVLALVFMIIGTIIYLLYDVKYITKSNIIYSLIRNYLPDIFWTLSFFFMNINFANNISRKAIVLNSIYVFVIALTFEFLQYFNIAKGTFDILDILFYSISIIIASFIESSLRRYDYEKNF